MQRASCLRGFSTPSAEPHCLHFKSGTYLGAHTLHVQSCLCRTGIPVRSIMHAPRCIRLVCWGMLSFLLRPLLLVCRGMLSFLLRPLPLVCLPPACFICAGRLLVCVNTAAMPTTAEAAAAAAGREGGREGQWGVEGEGEGTPATGQPKHGDVLCPWQQAGPRPTGTRQAQD